MVVLVLICIIISGGGLGKAYADDKSKSWSQQAKSEKGDENRDGGDRDTGEGDEARIEKGIATKGPTALGQSTTQDEAKEAVKRGKAVSLPKVLAYLAINYPGQVLDVKLRSGLFGFYYEVKYLDASNHLLSVTLDAQTLNKL